ncbi:DUF6175 family protein [Alistipes shahii]|jgi:hypothetical protein|uniref:DUF6175 family protein n=1 Tax=Alistipes shahii TaxID=328814 RepID=UPI00266D0A15|nr:DUF6175 family protein [Alistipes shahii]
MKKLLTFILLAIGIIPIVAQEKKPTLMILPSDNWCTQRYFTTTYQDQGTTVRVPDYKLAFQEDTELGGVIGKIGAMLTDLGYSLKDCEQEIKNISIRTAEDNVMMSKTSGASLVESPLDMLKRRTKSDIIIQLGWQVNRENQGKSVTFTLEAFDAYTSKRIATATGTSEPSTDIIPRMLERTVQSYIRDFDRQMDNYFRDLRRHGREIVLAVRCWDSWENDLETEYDGEELTDCIQQWMRDNTVDSSFNLTDGTESFAQFEQVRIPFFDSKGNAMDARAFATSLRKYLQQEPYHITSKVLVRGLGEAIIVLGEK